MELIIDNIRSAANIGSLFRTSDAFHIEKIYLCGISATPPNKEILKTALGATETVGWSHHENILELVLQLKNDPNNYLVAIEQDGRSEKLHFFTPPEGKKIILVLGNEIDGVSKEILDLVDRIVEIPQFGMKKSLNVAVAAGIAIWDILVKKGLNKPTA